MGTSLRIGVLARSRSEAITAIDDAFLAVRRLDDLLSTWRNDTDIARLNHAPVGHPVPLPSSLYRLLQEAASWSRLTDGAFDPAIGSLVDVWDLRGVGRIPDSAALEHARGAQGLRHFRFDDPTHAVSRTDSWAWLDTGGFGKGVALREARSVLLRRGVTRATLNFGGQVVVVGSGPAGKDWTVPVASPGARSRPIVWLHLRDRSASTSSQSERFVTAEGRHLGHIIDPRSGRPVPAWGSVTVVAQDPALADVISTALLVLGPEAGLQWARERRDVAVLFLIRRGDGVERRWNTALEEFLVADSTFSGGT